MKSVCYEKGCRNDAQRYFWIYTKFNCSFGELLVDGVVYKVCEKFIEVFEKRWNKIFDYLGTLDIVWKDLENAECLFKEKPFKHLGPTWRRETYADLTFQVVYLSRRFGVHYVDAINTLAALKCAGYFEIEMPQRWVVPGSGPGIGVGAISDFYSGLGKKVNVIHYDPVEWFNFGVGNEQWLNLDDGHTGLFSAHVLRDYMPSLVWSRLFVSLEDPSYCHSTPYVGIGSIARLYSRDKLTHVVYHYKPIFSSKSISFLELIERMFSISPSLNGMKCGDQNIQTNDSRLNVVLSLCGEYNEKWERRNFDVFFDEDINSDKPYGIYVYKPSLVFDAVRKAKKIVEGSCVKYHALDLQGCKVVILATSDHHGVIEFFKQKQGIT